MKRISYWLLSLSLIAMACNNEASDSVEQADSANEAKLDSQGRAGNTITTDQESTDFLVKAADGGMAEVKMGELAQQKATNSQVKSFASMLVNDHMGANEQVKRLAAQRNVTLPNDVSTDNQKMYDDLSKKTGGNFDKAYMDEMIDDHQKDIDLFEKASNRVNDAEIKTFIDNTLPKLRQHLDSARAINKLLK